ncbi:MAG TPA: Uma2 family endonuclease [Gemmataceae bacterium]|nr:Uma2 family endonuclease [Gemmataceae bacterium]
MSLTSVPPKLVLGLEHAGILMTPEEFDDIEEYDEEYCYELVHGVLVVTPIPLAQETDPNEELGYLLRRYKGEHPDGAALDVTLPQQYIPTRTSRRLADRVIWAGLGRLPNLRQDVPTVAVEFVSAGRRNRERDYTDKRQEYMEVGVVEYWIIDRFARRLTVVRNDPAGPQEVIVPEDGTYRTPLLPGFELALAPLLAVADQWAAQR